MTADYRPARWLPGPNLMTAYGSVLLPRPQLPFRRERWELSDGDFLDVDRLAGRSAGAPVLLICHGLEGSSRAPYVRGLAARASGAGLAVAALCFRGCSGEENRLARLYHSGETGDLALSVGRLSAERPGRRILLAGFSLGGNVVVKYLGERGEAAPKEVVGAVVVSVPYDLARSARALDAPGPWNWIYRTRFLFTLRAKALAKARRFPGLLDPAAVRAARTFAAFDSAATAPLHGFASAEDYWARSASGPFLAGVDRPLLAISALDDPLVPAQGLPLEAARSNPRVTLLTPAAGGHVGFVSGGPLHPYCWAEERAAAFLSDLARG
jgi:predicted alpha/beta-fold hydrolase